MIKQCFIVVICLLITTITFAQNDSLILINGDKIIGEIKSLDRGVVTVKTDYSDSDFKIEWDGIKEIYTVSSFMIILSDGTRTNGKIESSAPGKVNLVTFKEGTFETEINKIVHLNSVDEGFWDKVYASIDIGFDITKTNELKQFSTRSTLGYVTKKWSYDGSFNTFNSTQKEAIAIRRTDGAANYKYHLAKGWYLPASISFLSNNEQKLDIRSVGKIGLGKYFIQTNNAYWGFDIGTSINREKFSTDPEVKQSLEAYFGTELNLFDIGDLSILTKAMVYPSITEAGRWRIDFNFDMKYDLPMDFYIKLGTSLNYDNRPVEDASETDYVLHSGIGWEW